MVEGAIVVESTDISSSPEKKKRKTDDGNSSPSRPSPLVILINMPTHDYEAKQDIDRWYTVEIPADAVDGYEGWICEVWRRKTLPWWNSTVALLGSDLYLLGGRPSHSSWAPNVMPDVWKVNIRNATPTDDWISVQPMICPRTFPHALALGGKLYVLSGATFSRSGVPPTACGVEVYDPMTGSWEALPDPPCQIGYCTISAALENPNRILVTSNPKILPSKDSDDEDYEGPFYDYSSVNFLMYDVQNCSWKMLDPACRQIHPQCPWRNHGEAVAVGNCLYWVTTYVDLLAYDFQLDLWLIGDLRGLNVPFLEYDYEPRVPGLFHLENERFCLIQHRGPAHCFVHCVLFDVSPILKEKKLRISYVSTIKYKEPYPSPVMHSFLMGK